MGFDRLMHDRNRYKHHPPNFNQLAVKHKRLRDLCRITTGGKVLVDFKDENVVRTLSETLLEEDFNVHVSIPKDYLVPRIPQRLNYVLVLEDLLALNGLTQNVVGFDIGTGPACIYPMLALRQNPTWKMYASELNPIPCAHALANAHKNFSAEQLIVFEADADNFFKKVTTCEKKITFTMCNPPFFDTDELDLKFSQLSSDDPQQMFTYSNEIMDIQMDFSGPPHSRTIGQHCELSVDGGEVGFVKRMIEESVLYGDRIAIFTSLLGKKASLRELSAVLQRMGIQNHHWWTIGQGRTCRWIIGWSLQSEIMLK